LWEIDTVLHATVVAMGSAALVILGTVFIELQSSGVDATQWRTYLQILDKIEQATMPTSDEHAKRHTCVHRIWHVYVMCTRQLTIKAYSAWNCITREAPDVALAELMAAADIQSTTASVCTPDNVDVLAKCVGGGFSFSFTILIDHE